MAAFKLRPYQQDLVDRVRAAWETVRAVLVVLATGGGKTVIFSTIMHDHVGASAAVVHRKEIVGQISMSLAILGVKHRIVAPPAVVRRIRRRQLKKLGRSFIDPGAQCGVVSVQTLASRSSDNNAELQRWANQVTLAVYDEGHHYVDSGSWAKAVDLFARAKLLFVTATPERADGKGLGADADGYADAMIEGPTTGQLIKQGYLSPYRYFSPDTDLDVEGLAVTASGDFNAKAFRARVVESHLVGDVVSQYREFAGGKKAIVFSTDVITSEEQAAAFRAAGYRAAALSGETDQGERDRVLDAFEGGEYDVLVNVDLFDEGFDVPAVECVITARPTESLAKFLQMIGRGLRPVYATGYDLSTREGRAAAIAAGPKPFAIVIDPVRNWERHGMPDWPRRWTLDSREKGRAGARSDVIPQKVCTGCTQPYEAFRLACPYCGAIPVPPDRSAPEHVEGNLLELDVDALAALFEEMQAADMPDEDFQRQQIARNVPAIGRGAGLKRHRAAKYRRQVLRELVGWWVGAQPGRETGEVHKRFFYRFGVDIGTAFTLPQKDTEALIETIQQRFTEDMTHV